MRPIDADALKQHYAWWGEGVSEDERDDERGAFRWKHVFDQIVDAQPSVEVERIIDVTEWREGYNEGVQDTIAMVQNWFNDNYSEADVIPVDDLEDLFEKLKEEEKC